MQDLEIPLTNSAAERALRPGVILRCVQGGTKSEQGNRWIERILSLRETLRLQDRSALDYLQRCHRRPPGPARTLTTPGRALTPRHTRSASATL